MEDDDSSGYWVGSNGGYGIVRRVVKEIVGMEGEI
jgi:hypothetical protein